MSFTAKHQTVAVKKNTIPLFQELYPNIRSHNFDEESSLTTMSLKQVKT